MKKYRRSDQYYYDEYDRSTIEDLKEKERAVLMADKLYQEAVGGNRDQLYSKYLKLNLLYTADGAKWARDREREVRERISADEQKDDMVSKAPVPVNIKCRACSAIMELELADFIGECSELAFFFSCPLGHVPGRAIYADGRERYRRERICGYCNGSLISKKKKTKSQIIFTNTCQECGKVEVIEFETEKLKIMPIDEADRKKYCTGFVRRKTFLEDLQALADLDLPERDLSLEEANSAIKVQKLTIAMLEKLLGDEIEKTDFIKLQFEPAKTGRFLTLGFSVQDPTDREEAKSIKSLKRLIEMALFPTNWRLMAPGIACTLGHLSGRLKGYALSEDLKEIEKEIRK